MPRVSARGRNLPRNSVKDRPSRWQMLGRRARRLIRPAGWFGAAALTRASSVAKPPKPRAD